jgi:predicted amidohydrolase
MKDLKVAFIQSDLHWELPELNRARFSEHMKRIEGEVDIIVLCEMFTTGFTMNTQVAEQHHPEAMATLKWMKEQARNFNAVVTGSVAICESERNYNRLYWVRPDGLINTYDKRHTFTFAGEHNHYHRGESRIIEEWRGWKICPLICYDLRFPVWSRNRIEDGVPLYDVLVYVANWPEARKGPWSKLLPARAIENQCYVVAVNRVGTDGSGHVYSGDSVAIDPRGECITGATPHQEEVLIATFSSNELADFRCRFPVLLDADKFELDGR